MVPVSFDHAISFFIQHSLHLSAWANLVPHARLRLQIEPELIRGFERCFRWTPGMEPHVLQAPAPADLKELLPGLHVSGWIAGQRKVAAAMRTAKHDRGAVEDELFSLGATVAKPDPQGLSLVNPCSF